MRTKLVNIQLNPLEALLWLGDDKKPELLYAGYELEIQKGIICLKGYDEAAPILMTQTCEYQIEQEVPWQEVVSEKHPILCRVWNSDDIVDNRFRLVTEYSNKREYGYKVGSNSFYRYAEPLTKDDDIIY